MFLLSNSGLCFLIYSEAIIILICIRCKLLFDWQIDISWATRLQVCKDKSLSMQSHFTVFSLSLCYLWTHASFQTLFPTILWLSFYLCHYWTLWRVTTGHGHCRDNPSWSSPLHHCFSFLKCLIFFRLRSCKWKYYENLIWDSVCIWFYYLPNVSRNKYY